MDTRVKGLWLDALRNGEYEQAEAVLARLDANENVEGHCCLGVLSDLAVKEGVIPAPMATNDEPGYRPDHGRQKDRLLFGGEHLDDVNGSTTQLPEAVRKWAGLDEPSPSVDIPNDEHDPDDEFSSETDTASLAELNDGSHDFLMIADLIEEHL